MKKSLMLCLVLVLTVFPACAGGTGASQTSVKSTSGKTQSGENMNITLTIGTKTFYAVLEDNAASRAFVSLFPLTLDMSELNGNEYYNYLETSLPAASTNPKKINAGDIKLYGSNCVVIFYKSFSTSYSYTSLGKIGDTSGLLEALKSGGGKVRFSLSE